MKKDNVAGMYTGESIGIRWLGEGGKEGGRKRSWGGGGGGEGREQANEWMNGERGRGEEEGRRGEREDDRERGDGQQGDCML